MTEGQAFRANLIARQYLDLIFSYVVFRHPELLKDSQARGEIDEAEFADREREFMRLVFIEYIGISLKLCCSDPVILISTVLICYMLRRGCFKNYDQMFQREIGMATAYVARYGFHASEWQVWRYKRRMKKCFFG